MRIGDELSIEIVENRKWIILFNQRRIGEIYKFELDRLFRKLEKFPIQLICLVKARSTYGLDFMEISFYDKKSYNNELLSKDKNIPKSKIKNTSKIQTKSEGLNLTVEEQKVLKKHSKLKLQIELVPRKCFWSNVRSNIKKSQWDKIRKSVYQKAGFICEICGGKGTRHPVECHEVWKYDPVTMIQKLGFFQSLCPLCHEVKHIGLAGIRGNGERAFNRFRDINKLDDKTAIQIKNAVFKEWKIRSLNEWKLDIEYLKNWDLELDKTVNK